MKQLEPRIAAIGENTYYIRPLPAFRAANLTGELAAVIVPLLTGLAPLFAGANENVNLMDVDLEAASPAIGSAFSTLSGDKVEALLKKLLIDGGNITFETPDDDKPQRLTMDLANEIFCEEVQDMFLLAFEVIRTNYNGFFKKLSAQFGTAFVKLTKTTET